MKKLLIILTFFCSSATAQTIQGDRGIFKTGLYLKNYWFTDVANDTSSLNNNNRIPTAKAVYDFVNGRTLGGGGGGSMVYPGAGIPVSTGSAWASSITDNSGNWNTAYGWGDHGTVGYVNGTTPRTAWQVFGNHTSGSAAPTFGKLNVNSIDATGTPGSGNFLRGDGQWVDAPSSQWATLGSNIYYNTGNVGIGTINPQNTLSVSPIQYNTGTASQFLTTITGSGTAFSSAMVGSHFYFADGTYGGVITSRSSNTSITVSTSATVSSQAFRIVYVGLQVSNIGNVGINYAPHATFGIQSKRGILLKDPSTGNDGITLDAGSNLSPRPTITFSDAQNTQYLRLGTASGSQNIETAGNFYIGGELTVASRFRAASFVASDQAVSPPAGSLILAPYNSGASIPAFINFSQRGNSTWGALGTLGSGVSGGDLIYYTSPANSITFGGTERFRVVNSTGNFLIGTPTDVASSKLTISSTTQGFLPPRMTSSQRDGIASPATGLTLFCTDCTATDASTGVTQTYNGSTWKNHW